MGLFEKTWAALLRLLRKMRPGRRQDTFNFQETTSCASEYWDELVHRRHRKAKQQDWRSELSAYFTAANDFDTSARTLADNISMVRCRTSPSSRKLFV